MLLCLGLQAARAQVAAPAVAPSANGSAAGALVLVDPSGTLTPAQARAGFEAGQGKPVVEEEIMPLGHGKAVWYQIPLPLVDAPSSLMLEVRHAGLNNVDMYRQRSDLGFAVDNWVVQRAGDGIATAAWPVRHLTPAFELHLQPQDAAPALMRVAHNYPISVMWQMTEPARFQENVKKSHLLLGIYIGLILLIMTMSVVQSLLWRDAIHLFYAGYVLVVALGQLALTGLAGEYLWSNSPVWNDRAPAVLTVSGAALLHLLLRQLSAERAMPVMSMGLVVMAAVGGLLAASLAFAGRGPFGMTTAPYYLASMAIYLALAFRYAWRRPRVGGWILAAMLVLVACSMAPVMRLLSLVPTSFATQYGAPIGAAIEIPLLLMALYFRNHERRDNQARVGALTRVDPLSGVANHEVMMRRLTNLLQRQRREPATGAVMRVRLGNSLEIRNEYGLDTALTAVVHTGACITAVVSEGDTVARHRNGDFVLILDGRITREQLAELGQRLIARGLTQAPGLPPQTVLQLRIAVAQAPFNSPGAAELMHSLGEVLGELSARAGTALRFVSRTPAPASPETPPAAPVVVTQRAGEPPLV